LQTLECCGTCVGVVHHGIVYRLTCVCIDMFKRLASVYVWLQYVYFIFVSKISLMDAEFRVARFDSIRTPLTR